MEGIDLSTTQTENSDGSDEAKTRDSFGNGSDDRMEVSESEDRSDDEQCTMFNGKPYKVMWCSRVWRKQRCSTYTIQLQRVSA